MPPLDNNIAPIATLDAVSPSGPVGKVSQPVQPVRVSPSAPAPGLAAMVNAVQGAMSPLAKKLAGRVQDTSSIKLTWARILLCGSSNSGKTVTAAKFGTPDQVRIIFTRSTDQLIPLKSLGYKFLQVQNFDEFEEACLHPEASFGDPVWAAREDKILVVDDITRAKEWVVADASEDDKGNKQNTMRQYGDVNNRVAPVAMALHAKQMHIITTSHVDIKDDAIERVEKIWADLPTGLRKIWDRDTAFVFYLDTRRPWDSRLLTTEEKEVFEGMNEKFQKVVKTRYIYAKRKLDLKDELGVPLLKKWEPADLGAVWRKLNKIPQGTV